MEIAQVARLKMQNPAQVTQLIQIQLDEHEVQFLQFLDQRAGRMALEQAVEEYRQTLVAGYIDEYSSKSFVAGYLALISRLGFISFDSDRYFIDFERHTRDDIFERYVLHAGLLDAVFPPKEPSHIRP